jgi:hypothetical protein
MLDAVIDANPVGLALLVVAALFLAWAWAAAWFGGHRPGAPHGHPPTTPG